MEYISVLWVRGEQDSFAIQEDRLEYVLVRPHGGQCCFRGNVACPARFSLSSHGRAREQVCNSLFAGRPSGSSMHVLWSSFVSDELELVRFQVYSSELYGLNVSQRGMTHLVRRDPYISVGVSERSMHALMYLFRPHLDTAYQ